MNNSTNASSNRKQLCIIGLGTYGSYLLNGLLENEATKNCDITVIEIGNATTKNETEIGIKSIAPNTRAASTGRYFGFGGTSARWGGQILFFDKRDNPTNEPTWNRIVELNEKHKNTVIQKLVGTGKADIFNEDKGRTKVGLWLKYTNRNLFKKFKIGQKVHSNPKLDIRNPKFTEGGQLTILSDFRVVDFEVKNNILQKVICQNAQKERVEIAADVFYLTAGCIESCRLLLLLNQRYNNLDTRFLGKNFGDHLSVELCKIKNHKPTVAGTDFVPFFYKGNMVTKRWVAAAHQNNQIGYVHPVFNSEVKVFTSLKRMLFGKQKFDFSLRDVVEGFVFLVKFGGSLLFLRKLYADKKSWILRLDIEQAFPNDNQISLSNETDTFGQAAVKIDYAVSSSDLQAISDIQTDVFRLLKNDNIEFEPIFNPTDLTEKIEDVYHPVGTMPLGENGLGMVNFDFKINGLDNLYHFSTALFPSAKSINPTAAALCFIEEHLAAVSFQSSTLSFQQAELAKY